MSCETAQLEQDEKVPGRVGIKICMLKLLELPIDLGLINPEILSRTIPLLLVEVALKVNTMMLFTNTGLT